MDAKPSSLYLCGSFLLGCALVIWFFWENELHGKELVAAGVPTMACAAWNCAWKATQRTTMPVSEAPWPWLLAPTNAVEKVEEANAGYWLMADDKEADAKSPRLQMGSLAHAPGKRATAPL